MMISLCLYIAQTMPFSVESYYGILQYTFPTLIFNFTCSFKISGWRNVSPRRFKSVFLGNSGPLKRQNEQRTQYFKDYEKSNSVLFAGRTARPFSSDAQCPFHDALCLFHDAMPFFKVYMSFLIKCIVYFDVS